MSENKATKHLKKYVRERYNLSRYFFILSFDIIIWLVGFVLTHLFPFIISFIVAIICAAIKIPFVYDETLAWGLAGSAVSFFGITVSIILAVKGVNRKYFKKNSLTIFGSYKLFGIYNYYLLWTGAFVFTIGAITTAILRIKDVYAISVSSLAYTILIALTFIFICLKNDDNKFIKYLKNTGALCVKRGSIKISQNIIFMHSHPKIMKFSMILWIVIAGGQNNLNDTITDYFNDKYSAKDGNLIQNINLLKIYFEKFPKYLSSDLDIILLTKLIKSINDKMIEYLLDGKEYEVVKDILESMLTLSIEVFRSKYFLEEVGYNISIKECSIEKDAKYIEKFLFSSESHMNLFISLFDTIILCFDKIRNLRSSNKYIVEIKKDIIPAFDSYKKATKKEIKSLDK